MVRGRPSACIHCVPAHPHAHPAGSHCPPLRRPGVPNGTLSCFTALLGQGCRCPGAQAWGLLRVSHACRLRFVLPFLAVFVDFFLGSTLKPFSCKPNQPGRSMSATPMALHYPLVLFLQMQRRGHSLYAVILILRICHLLGSGSIFAGEVLKRRRPQQQQ